VGAQQRRERVVLGLGLLDPHDLVEQQLVDVGRGEALQFQVGAVQQHRAEVPDLGRHVEAHARLLVACRPAGPRWLAGWARRKATRRLSDRRGPLRESPPRNLD
jgi:hypothetical protein